MYCCCVDCFRVIFVDFSVPLFALFLNDLMSIFSVMFEFISLFLACIFFRYLVCGYCEFYIQEYVYTYIHAYDFLKLII